jgi:Fe-S-cluster containining protein
MAKIISTKQVPCNGCTLCCQGDTVRLEKEDSPTEYKTEPHPFIPGALMIAHKPNGECIYLENNGCRIHGHAPSLCRIADCRSLALRIDFMTARRLHAMNRLDIRVWDQGHKLLQEIARENKNVNNEEIKFTDNTDPKDT